LLSVIDSRAFVHAWNVGLLSNVFKDLLMFFTGANHESLTSCLFRLSSKGTTMKPLSYAFLSLMFVTHPLFAATLTDGNILVSNRTSIYEYTLLGTQVQKLADLTDIRDIAVDAKGTVFVYDGTFNPVLRIIDPASGTSDSLTFPEWSTVNNGSFGGIAAFDRYVFVTDMWTYGDSDSGKGVIRFDVKGRSAVRFAGNLEPIDLNIGKDKLLYVLSPGGSPEGRIVHIFNPVDLTLIDTLNLAGIFGWTGHRSIAAAANGDMFIADWDGDIQRIDSTGAIKDTAKTSAFFNDIDITRDGNLLLGDHSSILYVYDSSLTLVKSTHIPGSSDIFVTPIELDITSAARMLARHQVSGPSRQITLYLGSSSFRVQSGAVFTLTGRLVRPAGMAAGTISAARQPLVGQYLIQPPFIARAK
jgi:hypothetical protein